MKNDGDKAGWFQAGYRAGLEAALEYAEHGMRCPAGRWEKGEPTKPGDEWDGYRTMYDGKWYARDEEPPCSCGLTDLIHNGQQTTNKETNND